MADSVFSDVVSAIIKILGSGAYKKIVFAKDLNSHIKRLQQLKTTIEATLLDARSLETCSNAQKDTLEKLDCALADLDYFLDVTSAKAKQKEIMHGNKFIKEVHFFFSKSNQLYSPFRDAHKLKAIIETFESISRDLSLVRDIIRVPSVSRTQMVSTGSLWSNCQILTEVVIGRDKDRDEVVSMLLDDSFSSQTFSVVSIVGIGGVGKTTLAKYAYHDDRLKYRFDVRFWVSTTQDFDVRKVLLQILATFGGHMSDNCDISQMYDCFKRGVSGKKFLLVLDNIWDQEGLWQKWQDLTRLLALGVNGSRVLLTTRNKKVAKIMGCVNPYDLGDLTKENSWLLFQKIAFIQCQDPALEAIGKEIVNMCPNVPLVIQSIGGLLARKCTVMEWQAFRNDQLANFSSYGSDIMQTLKLSYDQLDERLKPCVAYCSLFPKGYQYNKTEMIELWLSLGYIELSYENQCLEDAAENFIMMLAIQGFFTVDYDCLWMHDLMHDLVLSVVGFKYKRVKASGCEIDERVRHLSLSQEEPSTKVLSSIFNLKKLRSLLVLHSQFEWSSLHFPNKIFNIFPRMRILSLSKTGIKEVPSSVGKLVTLRYLNLSHNPITDLPNSITQLVELLSLNVSFCKELQKFPKGIKKLVKLRHIRNLECPAPIPEEMASLTELQTLKDFPIKFSEGFPRETDCGLSELNIIMNRLTTRSITIIVIGDANSRSFKAKKDEWEIRCNLEVLWLEFKEGSTKGDAMVLEALQPNTNLEHLRIKGYKGERFPRWIKDGVHYFENLVDIRLHELEGCRSIGSFGRLLHLKRLWCQRLEKVEYIEENRCGGTTPSAPLFPSLEQLWLVCMPKLKEWYKVSSSSNSSEQNNILLAPNHGFLKLWLLWVTKMEIVISMSREFRGFSTLQRLQVDNCEELKVIPVGIPNLLNLKKLDLYKCSEELNERVREPNGEDWPIINHIPYLTLTSSPSFCS